ncbi:MAG: pyruvate:ferredoxin (flavodoxin) oxidoreductase [Muribaculaceae bacterium]|nr:pyruvate:ferredoxin (flavodoxin) oxidoreductase [Muribaculaceae bacterium]
METPLRTITDGCTAAAYVAYALSDIATIYPITPIASMGDTAQKWAVDGRVNVFGRTMKVVEMESELGAAGATHGALSGGALATTFTSSQGLLLMIPNMYKISGELLPGVFHVGCRSLATHALSIFGDHQDTMACRATGFTFLVSDSVQATADLGIVAHLAAIEGSLPVLHMFDGWRTSNEMSTIELLPYSTIASLVDKDAVERFRQRGMNPNKPDIRGTAQNSDVYFQNREAPNRFYDAFPAIVEKKMQQISAVTGRKYSLFDYHGVPDAESVIVIMGSGAKVANEAADWMNAHGYKTGVINVRLFRPFSTEHLLAAMPQSVKSVAVLDRTKEPGADGEPLYQDVAVALFNAGRQVKTIGVRYGLSSKDFTPAMAKAVIDALPGAKAGAHFTVGINDDVTHLSLTVGPELDSEPAGMHSAIFFGMGSDGTVGATRQAADILSDLSGNYAQAYFEYSAKKSGGYTVSSLRLSPEPVETEYAIEQTDYVGCNKDHYATVFDVWSALKPGSVFTINTAWTDEEISMKFPAALKRAIAGKKVHLYAIDGAAIAAKHGLGVRINTIMETVYLKLSGIVDFSKSIAKLKQLVSDQYAHEGDNVVQANIAAIDDAASAIREVAVPADWISAEDAPATTDSDMPEFVCRIAMPCLRREGDNLPVSALTPDGFCPPGETAWEKRTIALQIPEWDPDKCLQCTLCSLVCAHAAIRPVVADEQELSDAPAAFGTAAAKGLGDGKLRWRIQVYPRDCTGCGSCVTICPGHALTMQPLATQLDTQDKCLAFAQTISEKNTLIPRDTPKGSQLWRPLLEFSGACGGCGETPYVKLLTQLFGERLVIANATGCSSIWGADFPSMPYTVNADGHGPAWANSLFEDNAEYGYGIALALQHVKRPGLPENPSVWAIGGDGWAYDIGYAGLDHVLAQNTNINILVMDTECYSNTGGQMSKATPISCVAKYAPHGKRTVKKDLGRMALTYGHVYVGMISLAANPAQAVTVLKEAEAYDGPSIVIAYCPCINHGIKAGMGAATTEMRRATATGYWPLWRFDPSDTASPFKMQSADPDGKLEEFLSGENRYADLQRVDPTDTPALRADLDRHIKETFTDLHSDSATLDQK